VRFAADRRVWLAGRLRALWGDLAGRRAGGRAAARSSAPLRGASALGRDGAAVNRTSLGLLLLDIALVVGLAALGALLFV
jgi:hypothetical protein